MEQLIAGILCALLVLAIFLLLWHRRRQQSLSPHEHEDDPQPLQADRAVRQPRPSRMRRRPAAAASSSGASTSAAAADDDDEDALVETDEEVAEDDPLAAKATTKKEKKKQEREAQRQAEEAARESRTMKQDRYAEMRRKKDEEREAQERRMEEEAMARKAKEEEAAAFEFEKWKGEFSIDAEGTTENEMQDEKQGLLFNFVEYIKKQKCVPLEDLAAEFKLRTQSVCLLTVKMQFVNLSMMLPGIPSMNLFAILCCKDNAILFYVKMMFFEKATQCTRLPPMWGTGEGQMSVALPLSMQRGCYRIRTRYLQVTWRQP